MKKRLFEEFETCFDEEEIIEADDMGMTPEEAAFMRGWEEAG